MVDSARKRALARRTEDREAHRDEHEGRGLELIFQGEKNQSVSCSSDHNQA